MKKSVLLLFAFVWSSLHVFGQLTGMSNTSAVVGRTVLNTTITSNNTFIQAASPNGNIYEIKLRQGGTTLNLADGYSNWLVYQNVNVTSPSSFDLSTFSIPWNAPLGSYTLYVGYQDPIYQGIYGYSSSYDSLPNAFTVLPPDGYIQGTVYDDVNRNGVQDAGEQGISNGSIRIDPGPYYYSLNANGTFSIPENNGSYTVSWVKSTSDSRFQNGSGSTYAATINNANSTGNDFYVHRKLRFAAPNQVVAGQQIRITLVGDTLFSPGTNFLNYVTFRKMNGSGTFYLFSQNITITDSSTANLLTTIPYNASAGVYQAIVYISNGSYYGSHYLDSVFTVVPSTATISGTVYFDQNSNGSFDAGEAGLRGQRVHLLPDDAYAYADNSGAYNIGALPGNHTIAWDPPAGSSFVLNTGPASYSFNNSTPASGNNFGLRTTNPDYTSTLTMSSVRPRCNSLNTYYFTITNVSNVTFNGRLYLLRDMQTGWNHAVPPYSGASAMGDTIWWDLQNIAPFQPVVVTGIMYLPGPGTTLHHRAYFVSYDGNGAPQLTSSNSLNETVRCGFDPNDKSVTPEGIGPDHLTLINDELEYKIRFQNTGNDTAFDVAIYDRLDTSLDWNSLYVVESSHSVLTTLDRSGQVRFLFRNINLPDSNVNEPGSNGFVTYRIRPKSTVQDYTVVQNTAYIVFDLNPAIVTNTTSNTLVANIPLFVNNSRPATDAIAVYPNPLHDKAIFLFNNDDGHLRGFELYDLTGTLLRRERVNGNELTIEKNGLPAGIYLYRLTDGTGAALHAGKIVVQ